MITEIDISDESQNSISLYEDVNSVSLNINDVNLKLSNDQFVELVEKLIVYQRALKY